MFFYQRMAIPQSEIKDFCQPPLHKGAFTQMPYRGHAFAKTQGAECYTCNITTNNELYCCTDG